MGITIQSGQDSERLSALMDGEVQHRDIAHALRDIKQDTALMQRWDRYHLASDALRNDLAAGVGPDLGDRISAAIADEPNYLNPQRSNTLAALTGRAQATWLRPAAGFAVAASITAATLLGFQSLTAQQSPDGTPALAAQASIPQLAPPSEPPAGIQLASQRIDQQTLPQSKFNRLLLNHQQHQAGTTLQGVMPYARLVNTQP